jgi:hypothetical protein
MHVLTTAPFPHRYCTSPIRVLAQHACAHHGALSPQVLHIADPRARATIAETHSHRFRREDSLRGAAWSPRRLAELVCRRRRLSVASRYRLPRYRPGRLAADARDFDCDLWVKGFKKLPYHFVAFGGKPTHPLTHPMRVMRPSQNLEHENAKRSCARRDRAAAADFPSSVRFLKRASRQPYLRSHIWIHSVVVDSSCLAKPLL